MISNAIFKSIIFKYFKKLSTERLEEPTGQLNRLTIWDKKQKQIIEIKTIRVYTVVTFITNEGPKLS